MDSNPKVDFFFNKNDKWQEEIGQLRNIILDCGLSEALKWGCPCYLFKSHNIVLIHTFKDYCALLFFKGALLQDTAQLLIQQSENVQAARQIRFTDAKTIAELGPILKTYIYQAVGIAEAGLKVPLKKTEDFEIAAEFEQQMAELPALRTAFKSLTPGRQRAYLLYFSSAKQSKTRSERIAKYLPQILMGKGLND